MTRYFYTDPLAAAYMAKHFGIKLFAVHTDEQMEDYDLSAHDREFDWFDSCIIDGWSHEIEMVSDAVKYIEAASDKIYIHPDSLHILQPQEMDLIIANDVENRGITIRWENLISANIDWRNKPHDAQIIQRNGKIFFWPECEA